MLKDGGFDSCAPDNTSVWNNSTRNRTICQETQTDEYIYGIKTITDITNACILLTAAPVILIGNVMVVISVLRFRRLRTVMNMFVASLAFADSLVGIPTVPLYAMFYLDEERFQTMKYICLSRYVAVLASLSGSIISLTVVTLDRYIAVIHALHYNLIMTKRKARLMIAGIWSYAVFISSLPVLGVNVWKQGMVCDFFTVLPLPLTIFSVPVVLSTCLVAAVYMYARIFREARKNKEKMGKFRQQRRLERDTRMAKIMGFVFLLFLVFWTPFLMTSILKYVPMAREIFDMAKSFGLTLSMTNSVVNPIIYCWLRQDFRLAFKSLITCSGEGLFVRSYLNKTKTSNQSLRSTNQSSGFNETTNGSIKY